MLIGLLDCIPLKKMILKCILIQIITTISHVKWFFNIIIHSLPFYMFKNNIYFMSLIPFDL